MTADNMPSAATLDLPDHVRQCLEEQKDSDTLIDSGGGFGCRDFWVTVGGANYFVQVKRKEVMQ